MANEFQDRRRAPRLAVEGRAAGQIRPIIKVALVNLSTTGALIEHSLLLRPGILCELFIVAEHSELRLKARAVRSVVQRLVSTETGATDFIYHTGVEFLDLRPEDQEQLAALLQAWQAGGGTAPFGWRVFCLLL